MFKKCTPLRREAHVEGKSVKNLWSQTTFGSWDVQKVRAVAARSIFRSQKREKIEGYEALLDVVLRGRRKGLCALSRANKT